MLNPAITEYLIASQAREARREADGARFARDAAVRTQTARRARPGAGSRALHRWRAWGLSVTPGAFGSARPLAR
jgi:hypothetical protein